MLQSDAPLIHTNLSSYPIDSGSTKMSKKEKSKNQLEWVEWEEPVWTQGWWELAEEPVWEEWTWQAWWEVWEELEVPGEVSIDFEWEEKDWKTRSLTSFSARHFSFLQWIFKLWWLRWVPEVPVVLEVWEEVSKRERLDSSKWKVPCSWHFSLLFF